MAQIYFELYISSTKISINNRLSLRYILLGFILLLKDWVFVTGQAVGIYVELSIKIQK